MSDPVVTPRRAGIAMAIPIGLVLLAATFGWWFFYYSQYEGASKELETKAPCIAITGEDCVSMQKRLLGSKIPPYQPVLFWAGAIILGLGVVQQISRWR